MHNSNIESSNFLEDVFVDGALIFKNVSTEHLIKKSKNNITKARNHALELSKANKNDSNAYEWIGDNAYVFLGSTNRILSNVKATSRNMRISQKHLFGAFYLYCKNQTEKIDKENLLTFLNHAKKVYPRFSYDDFMLLKYYLCASLYVLCGDTCGLLLGNSKRISDKQASQTIKNCLLSLKYILSSDFDEFASLSPLEEVLCSDPSGVYPKMTKESKAYYRYCLEKLAKRKKTSKLALAKSIISQCENAPSKEQDHIGFYLLPKSKTAGKLYFALLFLLTFSSTLLFCRLSPIFILALFPIWEAVKQVLDRIFSLICKVRALPCLDLKEIPDKSGVLVVVTVLLTGSKQDDKMFSRLESMYHACSGRNVYFGLLCDLTDSDVSFSEKDKTTLENANRNILSLRKKYGDVFYLFTRKRSFNKSENKYMVYERKRGAVINLCEFLCQKNDVFDKFSIKPDSEVTSNIKYCITLDSDTNLPIDAVNKMAGAMLHPLNAPKVENGRVSGGFALLQPSVSTTLSSAVKSTFSFIMSGSVGSDLYSGARFDLYQSLFGNGIFCGKGIFDKNVFLELNSGNNAISDNTVLSHDAIEGAHLNCNMLTSLVLTDTYPKNELSYFKRLHRWIRGDIQNMIFLFGKVPSKEKGLVKNNITPLSKFKLFDNIRRHLVPVFSLLCLVISLFFPSNICFWLTLVSLIYIAVPFLLDLVFSIQKGFHSATRKFFSRGVRTGLHLSLLRFLMSLCMAIKNAFVSIDAVTRSLYRMFISKKKMLEWTTASQSDFESADGLLGYVSKNIGSVILGFVFFVFSGSSLLKICALLWFFSPVIFYMTSKPWEKTKRISKRHKKKIISYSAKMWKFFEQNVTFADNHLVPDNIQFFPEKRVCHRTSPTNIGLYIVSAVCANVFSFITKDELKKRLCSCIETVEKLQKYKGNLYNWYDTVTLEVLSPKFISSVDSGNFVACLIAAKQMLIKIQSQDEFSNIISRLEKLIKDTDLYCLYNENAKLFSLGLSVTDKTAVMSENCYDLYMSEARTLSYIAVSTRCVDKEHWARLSRRYIGKHDRIGLASWTGTAFEYFMPALFLSVPEGSVSFEALGFALMCQKARTGKTKNAKVWGISESAYFDFDPYLNYQYKAHGIPSLALKRGLEQNLVISPYSSFLALEFDTDAVMQNLSVLEKLDMYDKYGFYEALDFTPNATNKKVCAVQSYMAHHVGMSLVSCTNACFDEIVRKSFMKDVKMQCAQELLYEKVDADATLTKSKHEVLFSERLQRVPEEKCKTSYKFKGFEQRVCTILSDGKVNAVIADNGYMQISSKDICINNASPDNYDLTNSLFIFAKIDGKVYSASPLPLYKDNVKYIFEKQSGLVKYIAIIHEDNNKKCTFEAKITIDSHAEHAFKIQTVVKGLSPEKLKDVKFAVCFEPVLTTKQEYTAHKTFADLFVSCKKVKQGVMFTRRSRNEGTDFSHLLVCTTDEECDFVVFKDKIFDLPLCKHDFSKIFDVPECDDLGALINPYCLARFGHSGVVKNKAKAQIALVFAKDKETLSEYGDVFKMSFDKASDTLCILENNLRISCALSQEIKDKNRLCPYMNILTSCVFKKPTKINVPFGSFGMDKIWQCSVSGDLPIVTVILESVFMCSWLREYIRAFLFLSRMGFKFDLIILCRDSDKYTNPCYTQIIETVNSCSAHDYISRSGGGIFVVDRESTGDNGQKILGISSFVIDFENIQTFESTPKDKQNISIIRKVPFKNMQYPKDVFISANGYFDNKDLSYTLDKSKRIKTVMSHVLASKRISTVLTHVSLGYTFDTNASLKRITPFYNDIFEAKVGECVYLCDGDKMYDAIACSRFVNYSFGFARYIGSINNKGFDITVYVPENAPLKIVKVKANSDFAVDFCVLPLMSASSLELGRIQVNIGGGFVRFYNPYSQHFEGFGFVGGYNQDSSQAHCKYHTDGVFQGFVSAGFEATCDNTDKEYTFCIGSAKNTQEFDESIAYFFENQGKSMESAKNFAHSLIAPMNVCFDNENDANMSVKCMFDKWLCYQNGASRFFASSGFYQSGGASGFRDKLQDCLTLMYSRPSDVREHIIESCKVQFEEGDVLHWWHNVDGKIMGVRTKISDDTLFLPYVTAKYISFTGDLSLLDVLCPYIYAKALSAGESDKYITPEQSSQTQSVYKHCLKSIFRVLSRTGKDGLCLIGTGDWCDGLNRVGKDEKGQSVWLSMFLVLVLKEFSKICLMYDDDRMAFSLENKAQELSKLIENTCFDNANGYFYRAFADDYSIVGSAKNDECKIDSLSQSFCAISSIGTKEQIYSALTNSYDKLFDKEYKIYKLFSPPFQNTPLDVGYIKGYVTGIRENGGQYTHAAVWACIALFEGVKIFWDDVIKRDVLLSKAKEVLFSLITPYRMTDDKLSSCYRCEPYVVCADIYSNELWTGRGGWSWYTGAAGWLWRTLLEKAFCVYVHSLYSKDAYIEFDKSAFFVPCELFGEFTLNMTFKHIDAFYSVRYCYGDNENVTLDGKMVSGKIYLQSGKHNIVVSNVRDKER